MLKVTRFVFALLVGLAFGCLSCSLPPAVVISQATPNPLVGQHKFAVAPVAFATPLRVGQKTEEGYLVGKSADDVKSWNEGKDRVTAQFVRALTEKGLWDPGAPFTVRPAVTFVEPGFYVGVASNPAEVDFEVTITDAQGKVIDKIEMRPKGSGFSVGQRVAFCGLVAGVMTAEYLEKRTRGD